MSRARSIHAEILDAFHLHKNLEIDCKAATEVDLSFIQIVLSARKSAVATGKSLRLAHKADGVLHDALTRAGFLGSTAGKPAAEHAFWLEG